MPFVKVGQAELFYELRGAGPTICHLHGGTLGRNHFALLSPLLVQDFRVLDFDLCGVGASAATPMPETLEAWADDLAGLLDAIGVERAYVHGASAGGLVALVFAARHPDRVDRLILSSMQARPDRADALRRRIRNALMRAPADGEAMLAWFAFMFFSRAYLDSDRSAQGLDLLRPMIEVVSNALAANPDGGPPTDIDLGALLPRIAAPALVVAGRHDITTPLEPGPSGIGPREIAERLGGTLRIVDAGHLAIVEQPQEVADLIYRWIKGEQSQR